MGTMTNLRLGTVSSASASFSTPTSVILERVIPISRKLG
jgi:hypothetical protein